MKHIPALDGLRGIAVLMVVVGHSFSWWYGRFGVDVFFVLSGYLITSILAAEANAGGIRLGAFYLRRARRLYPALLVMVFLAALAAPLFNGHPTAGDAAIALLYLSDYGRLYDAPAWVLAHTWSLSVEEHFYLAWPFAVMALARWSRPRAAIALAVAVGAAIAWHLYVERTHGETAAYFRFDARLSGLLLGALLAYLPPLDKRAALPAVLCGLVLAGAWHFGHSAGVFEAITAGLILLLANGKAMPLLAWAPLAYIGRISYGIYLYHGPVVFYFKENGGSNLLTLTVALAISLPLAALSFATIEKWAKAPRRAVPSALPATG